METLFQEVKMELLKYGIKCKILIWKKITFKIFNKIKKIIGKSIYEKSKVPNL